MDLIAVLRILVGMVSGVTMAFLLYQVVVAAFVFKKEPAPGIPVDDRYHRFAVLVSARNERDVLPYLIDSLAQQDYPRECFDIYVIADNCTDDTAQVARDRGAIVLERNDMDHRGKGFALKWFFQFIQREKRDAYDAFCVFDADNLADRGFLAAMDRSLRHGVKMAQGYRDSKNPGDSWISGGYSIYFWPLSHFFFTPRSRLGLACIVGGTGFMFAAELLDENGWNTHTVTEDMEFSAQQVLKGVRLGFCREARFYDEQPTKLKQSCRQRYRWAVGNLQCLSYFVPRIFRELVRKPRFAHVDLLIFFFSILSAGLVVINSALSLLLGALTHMTPLALVFSFVMPVLGGAVIMVLQGMLTVKMAGKRLRANVKGILGWPLFLYTWSLINLYAIFYRKVEWKPIHHTKTVSIEKVNRANTDLLE